MPGHHLLLFGNRRDQFRYATKVKSIASANLIAYWPGAESSGTAIVDESGNGRNGTYSGVTLAQPGIGDGRTCPLYDGVNDYGNIYSVSLNGAWLWEEWSIHVWAQVSGVGLWSDGLTHAVIAIQADTNNRIMLYKSATNNFQFFTDMAAGIKTVTATRSDTAWMALGLTFSKSGDAMKAYINGAQSGATVTGLSTGVGALAATLCVLGGENQAAGRPWSGTIAHAALWNTPLTAAQMAALAVVP